MVVSILLFLSIFVPINGIQETKCVDPPPTEWTKTYGGEFENYGHCVVQTSDGGYAIAGETSPPLGGTMYHFYLVKTYPNGTLQWDQAYGVSQSRRGAYSLVQASDGGYAMAGYDYYQFMPPTFNNYQYCLLKTDSNGNDEFTRTYGGGWPDDEKVYSIIQTSDGGYAMVGDTDYDTAGSYDVWFLKVDSSGIVYQITKSYGGTNADQAYAVIQVKDDNYAIAGSTQSYSVGGWDFWLIFTDPAGNPQWNQTYGGGGSEVAYSVIQTSDGGYALAGYTNSYGAGGSDFWLVKTDNTGNIQWNHTYGGTESEGAYSVVQTGDGGYALGGYTRSFGAGYQDFWLVKTDSDGNMQWNKTVGGADHDYAYSMVQTSDGGFALAGYTYSESSSTSKVMLTKIAPEIHDIAVTDITLSKTIVGQGYETNINITVENQGTMNENFHISIRADKMAIGSITDIALSSASSVTVTFTWDTTGVIKGDYMISAHVAPLPSEEDVDDNNLVDGTQIVTIAGDVDGDRTVAVLDLFALGKAYGSTVPSPNWNACCDIDNSFDVNGQDLSILSGNYGVTDT